MVTKFNTGDKVLVPATIRSAEERNGNVQYTVDVDWNISEDRIIKDESNTGYDELVKALMPERYGYSTGTF